MSDKLHPILAAALYPFAPHIEQIERSLAPEHPSYRGPDEPIVPGETESTCECADPMCPGHLGSRDCLAQPVIWARISVTPRQQTPWCAPCLARHREDS